MTGSEFVAQYAKKGLVAWEAAALALARTGGLVTWPWIEVPLTDGTNQVKLRVSSDVLAVGTPEDHVRLAMTPTGAQGILNLTAMLLPTPWLEYQIWRAAPAKVAPLSMVPNLGADLAQYAAHSRAVDAQIASSGQPAGSLVSGHQKGVVVANFYKPGKVLLFGWYRPPPAPDVFDDGRAMGTAGRQPIQPKSNIHGDFYVDYSHGIRAIASTCEVDAPGILTGMVPTDQVYQHAILSRLVSNEGPVRTLRYPSSVPIAPIRPVDVITFPTSSLEIARGGEPATTPSAYAYALAEVAERSRNP